METADYSETSGLTYQTTLCSVSKDSSVIAMYVLVFIPNV
jgi:hypothetical protein